MGFGVSRFNQCVARFRCASDNISWGRSKLDFLGYILRNVSYLMLLKVFKDKILTSVLVSLLIGTFGAGFELPLLAEEPHSNVSDDTSESLSNDCIQMIVEGFRQAQSGDIKTELVSIDTIEGSGINTLTARFDGDRYHAINVIDEGFGESYFESIYIEDRIYSRMSPSSSDWIVATLPASLASLRDTLGQFQDTEGMSNCQILGTETVEGATSTIIEFDDYQIYDNDGLDIKVRVWLRPDGLPSRYETNGIYISEDDSEPRIESTGTFNYDADFSITSPN